MEACQPRGLSCRRSGPTFLSSFSLPLLTGHLCVAGSGLGVCARLHLLRGGSSCTLTHSLTHSLSHSLTCSLSISPTPSLPHSLIHSLTHSQSLTQRASHTHACLLVKAGSAGTRRCQQTPRKFLSRVLTPHTHTHTHTHAHNCHLIAADINNLLVHNYNSAWCRAVLTLPWVGPGLPAELPLNSPRAAAVVLTLPM